jgi:hypothetical protein
MALQSWNGALANVTLDGALRGNVSFVFRQSLKDSERRPSPTIGSIRGQRDERAIGWLTNTLLAGAQ